MEIHSGKSAPNLMHSICQVFECVLESGTVESIIFEVFGSLFRSIIISTIEKYFRIADFATREDLTFSQVLQFSQLS